MINKTYIVNLERCPEKRKHMEEEFKKLENMGINLNHEFFNAIDGKNKDQVSAFDFQIPNWYDPKTGKAMTSGEVGCSLSHYSIWKNIVNNVESGILPETCRVLILEDDVVFLDGFMEKLEEYHKNLGTDYDMLYLHRKPLDEKSEKYITDHIKKALYSYWTCAYILTYGGAKKLINANFLNNLIPVDEFFPIMYGCKVNGFENLYDHCEKIKCLAVVPSMFKLKWDSFTTSETYHADAYEIKKPFLYIDENRKYNRFAIILFSEVLDKNSDNIDRFLKFGKIYGLPVYDMTAVNEKFGVSLKKQILSWDKEAIPAILVLAINMDKIGCLPICPPLELIQKYHKLAKDGSIIVPKELPIIGNNYSLFGYAKDILSYLTDNSNLENPILAMHNSIRIIEDNKFEIFLPLNDEKSVNINTRSSRITHNDYGTSPGLVFGFGRNNILLNRIENYTGNGWNEYYGYRTRNDVPINLPKIYLSLYLKSNKNILKILKCLEYPNELLSTRINIVGSKLQEPATHVYDSEELLYARDIDEFLKTDCDYYFFIDHCSVINNPLILKDLLSFNKNIIAPFIRRPNAAWSNFWGDLDAKGYYKRSPDYMAIIDGERKSLWNVPYINGIYLVKRNVLEKVPGIFRDNRNMDIDMRFCFNLRENGVFMYVTNLSSYGYIEEESVENNIMVSGDLTMYDLFTKRDEWEKKYLHPKYYEYKNNLEKMPYKELITDIYNFPLFSEDFCREMIIAMEKYGKWSAGKDNHNDPRLGEGYYENVPTSDQHFFEIGFDKHWNEIVMKYVAPMASLLYSRYKTKGVHLGFIVKYHYDGGQRELQPHHDASTYTINVALNRAGIDFTGGGCHFIRQKFKYTNQEVGTATIHAGRLTAFHEGLPITSGTRYILVSFIN